MAKKNQNARSNNFDFGKAFAIICVVIGHSVQYGSGGVFLESGSFFYNPLFKFIYSFHMPLFMLISGYLFYYSSKRRSWKENIIQKVKTLLIPIFCWALVYFLYQLVSFVRHGEPLTLVKLIKTLIVCIFTNTWFLWAVFICSILVSIVGHIFDDSIIVYLLLFIITFFLPDSLNLHCYKFMYPYFVGAYLFHKKSADKKIEEMRIVNSPLMYICIAAIFFLLLAVYNYDAYIYTSGYCIIGKNPPLKQMVIDIFRFGIGIAGCIFILLSLHNIYKPIVNRHILESLAFIGRDTLGIYVISGFIFLALPKLTSWVSGFNILITLMETCIVLFVSTGCTEIIKKNPLLRRLLLGMK